MDERGRRADGKAAVTKERAVREGPGVVMAERGSFGGVGHEGNFCVTVGVRSGAG